ncbi:MAG: cation diffusion facilitator family transporter [Planctomycetota bacterium]
MPTPLEEYKAHEKRRLILSIVVTGLVMVVEIVGGIMSNSMALLSDAGHMFTHMFALGIALAAIYIASRDPRSHRTFGLYRVEVLAALLNSLFLFAVTVGIVWESVVLLMHPAEVKAVEMLAVAALGLVANLASIYLLQHAAHGDMNIKSAFIHVIGDAASSVGVVVGAIVIHYTGWNSIDPILALGIALIIALWAVDMFRDAVNVLLETAPKGMDVDTLRAELQREFPELGTIYDLHIWVITTNMYMFSAHIALARRHVDTMDSLRDRINTWLRERHEIEHTTIEFDIENDHPADTAP